MSNENRKLIPSVFEIDSILATGDFAISLYNKGHFGVPVTNGVRLNGFEALHLLELGRIEINKDNRNVSEAELIEFFTAIEEDFMLRYFVYKDLRNRGYIINVGVGSSYFFRLYPRNSIPKNDGAKYYIKPLREGGHIITQELNELVELAGKSKKELILGMVDAVGDVSYLKVSELSLKLNE